MDIEKVTSALETLRVGKIIEEYDLQDKIAKAFDVAGIEYQKEYRLGTGSRVDFLTAYGIAVEVKKGKPNRASLETQINRYAEFEEVQAIIIVVETSLKFPIKQSWNGKPCSVIGLQKLWGIAL
ncbi:MAG TPA: hypothetical protein PKA19_06320 [Bacillota bacterium]|nr:hypothetical protein [Bacillota bacterium]